MYWAVHECDTIITRAAKKSHIHLTCNTSHQSRADHHYWLDTAWPQYKWLATDQQRDTDTAPDLTLFHFLTENDQVFHETDNTANDWSDWGNYRYRSGVQTIIQHHLTVAINEHDCCLHKDPLIKTDTYLSEC